MGTPTRWFREGIKAEMKWSSQTHGEEEKGGPREDWAGTEMPLHALRTLKTSYLSVVQSCKIEVSYAELYAEAQLIWMHAGLRLRAVCCLIDWASVSLFHHTAAGQFSSCKAVSERMVPACIDKGPILFWTNKSLPSANVSFCSYAQKWDSWLGAQQRHLFIVITCKASRYSGYSWKTRARKPSGLQLFCTYDQKVLYLGARVFPTSYLLLNWPSLQ